MSARLELEIYNPKSDGEYLQSIEFNYMELQSAIKQSLEKYKGVTYTDDNIKVAKADRATLNNFKKALDDKRKDVKKACLKPYEDFEKKIKELVSLIDAPIDEIDGQIKVYEGKKEEEKLNLIKEIFNEGIGDDLKGVVEFEQIYNKRWLNVTYEMSKVYVDIDVAISNIRKDLETIELLKSEHEKDIKVAYFRSLDLGEALKENEIRKQAKEKVEAMDKQRQAAGAMQGEPSANPTPPPTAQQPPQQQAKPQATYNEDGEKLYTLSFQITATKDQLQQLKEFFTINNIKYGRTN